MTDATSAGKLEGKIALVTGSTSGIGEGIALRFAREGALVMISGRDEQRGLGVIDQAAAMGVSREQLGFQRADLVDVEQCRALVAHTVEHFGGLDILVNNAAFQRTHESIQEVPSEEFEYTFRTNIFSMFYLCKAALPHMQPGSSIINVASIQAYQPSPSLLAYASTKGAIVTFTKALAQDAIKHGVRVNVVAPGPVWTPLIPATMPQEQVKQFGQSTLLERPAQPAELAPAFVFLASQESSYITGERIGVTGSASLP